MSQWEESESPGSTMLGGGWEEGGGRGEERREELSQVQ